MLQGSGRNHPLHRVPEDGEWPSRLADVAETDVIGEQLANSEFVDEESRKLAIEGAQRIDEMARQRGMGGDLNT